MSTSSSNPPDRVAYETLHGTIQVADVLETSIEIVDCRPVEHLRVQITPDTGRWLPRSDVIPIEDDTTPLE